MKYAISFIFIFTTLSSFNSCAGNTEKPYNKTYVQDQSILKIQRFDKDFHSYLANPTEEQYTILRTKYPNFLKAFGVVTVNLQDEELDNPVLFKQLMEPYFSNAALSKIYADALTLFSDLSTYELELTKANDLIKTYFIGKELPGLSIHVSGFKANTIVLDSIISVSTDKYLGKDYSGYKTFFESYQTIQMQPKYIVRDFLKAWLMSEFRETNQRKNLLSEVIYQGKILYALNELLPEWDESDILGYTEQQQEWCEEHAKDIWKMTIDHNYLFNSDSQVIQKYMEDAPYTAIISTESPGRVGLWLGLQIIKNYAKNTGHDLQSILLENNNQLLLKSAKYNP
ncbi:MAG: hypothetical protein QM653_09045 [Dysgonomonas sp.]|uniref:gliding motility protein GldB-related protein n=1 Tax=Dysgonomonas sp. TaxID=1891233 RepID=UPI0039E3E0A6